MNHMEFDRHMSRRDEEIMREVQKIRLKEKLRAGRPPRPGRSRFGASTWRRVLSLVRGTGLSEGPLGRGKEAG